MQTQALFGVGNAKLDSRMGEKGNNSVAMFTRPMLTHSIMSLPIALSAFLALLSLYAFRNPFTKHKTPPGPNGLPLFGNLFQLSMSPWKEFQLWKHRYGMSTPHTRRLISILHQVL